MPTNTHQPASDTIKRMSLSKRNGFMSHKDRKIADSVDYGNAFENGAMKEDRKLVNSQLTFCQTAKNLRWQDHYQANRG